MIRGRLYIRMHPSTTKCPPRKESLKLIPSIAFNKFITDQKNSCHGQAQVGEHSKCTKCHSFPYVDIVDEDMSKRRKVYCVARHYLDDPTELVRQLRDRPDLIKYTTGDTSDDSDDSEEEEDVACSRKK
jgi:hypothetical protein